MQVDSAAGAAVKRAYSGTFDCIAKIFKGGGLRALYSGIDAGILRQMTYGGPARPTTSQHPNVPRVACAVMVWGLPQRMAIYPMLVDLASPLDKDGKRPTVPCPASRALPSALPAR